MVLDNTYFDRTIPKDANSSPTIKYNWDMEQLITE